MPYHRASDRQPVTTILERQGTCSGKHHLLAAMFRELGLNASVPVGGVFVDVHNWVEISLPSDKMIIDATWSLKLKRYGFPANEMFELGKSQDIAYPIMQTYIVPDGQDPQIFKEQLLREYFNDEELLAREAFIQTLSEMLAYAES